MYSRLGQLLNEYKCVRGMISYALLWPAGSLIEQTLVEKRTFLTYDWTKCLRFSIYGALVMGPSMYVWVRCAQAIWPQTTLRTSVSKALTELILYDPVSICAFLFVMSLIEGKSEAEAKQEVKAKFLDTFKVGMIYWPTMQTLNFKFVPVKNQVVCTSFFSMIWSSFLAYMKHLEVKVDETKTE